ncbi:MAG: riboflavin synthase [Ignavibacteria bacterium]|nr:riboflavin synthase [Ignavibacteria bacterium]
MFTGIIEEVGKIVQIKKFGNSISLRVFSEIVTKDLKIGDSISVNGVCLTVVDHNGNFFEVDAVEETITRTNLGKLNTGSFVNLERARKFSDRIDGHIVQGHIDTTGKIVRIVEFTRSKVFYFSYPQEYRHYLVPKGSIAIDGISLTIAELNENTFSVSVIPFTLQNTNLRNRVVGELVNLEFDIIGKYVINYLNANKRDSSSSILNQYIEQPDL